MTAPSHTPLPTPVPWTVWLVPFLLSLLPLAGFYAEQVLRAGFEAEQRIGAWDERARQLATMGGTMATLETQVEHQAQRLRDRLEQDLLGGERWTGALLGKRFGQVFAREFRRPGTQLYGFAGSHGESLTLLPGEGLAQARGALVLGLMKKVVEREPPGAGEVRALNRRSAGLLGPDITFSALRDHAHGHLMPGLQGGKDLRFLWLPVRPGGRTAGAFLLLLSEVPDPAARKAWLLRQLAGSADHLPALLPFAVYLPAADRLKTSSTPATTTAAQAGPTGPDKRPDRHEVGRASPWPPRKAGRIPCFAHEVVDRHGDGKAPRSPRGPARHRRFVCGDGAGPGVQPGVGFPQATGESPAGPLSLHLHRDRPGSGPDRPEVGRASPLPPRRAAHHPWVANRHGADRPEVGHTI